MKAKNKMVLVGTGQFITNDMIILLPAHLSYTGVFVKEDTNKFTWINEIKVHAAWFLWKQSVSENSNCVHTRRWV